MDKVLVLGGSGLLGKAITNEINKTNKFQVYSTYYKSQIKLNENRSIQLDIEDSDKINTILNYIKPQVIVSCLRGDYDKQLLVHIKAAEYLRKNGGNLYFCSTTNVFDNDVNKPHYEDDLPNSSTDYGQYKIECERKITEILYDNVIILRLPQIWGKDSPRIKQLLKSLSNNEKVIVYPRLFISTNTDVMAARQVQYIMDHNFKGIFHLAADDVVNHKEFCNELVISLGFSNLGMEDNFDEEGYFALLSKRSNEFPEQLRVTNKMVINCLI